MDSVFSNNSIYGGYGNGMMYNNQARKELIWTNAMTAEEEKALHKGTGGISLDIPKEDMYRAKCTHRDPVARKFTLRENNDGSVTCLKCGATFNLVNNASLDEIKRVVGGVIDILQTTKLAYIDMTPEVIQTYFVILPFLEIAPKLYEAAMHTLEKAMPGMGVTANHASTDAFNSLYTAAGTMSMPYGYPPMMGGMMNPPTGEELYMKTPDGHMVPVSYSNNPMQTQPNMIYPGVVDSTATVSSAPQEGQPVQVGKKFKLD